MFNNDKLNERLDTLQKMTPEELHKAQKDAHLEAFEDVMRLVRQLAGWGQYDSYIKSPSSTFDYYYEMTIEELHNEREKLQCQATEYVCSKHPPQEKTIYRELREDEQDTEE